uniref:Cyclin-dependent kinase inhibitor 1-like n=1 Tax=Sander lucioperca TaxID=283035 RepID=A0A8C9ZPA8_SANLU
LVYVMQVCSSLPTRKNHPRRMNPIRRRESVCRSLFGPVDHEQLRRDLTLKLKEISEQDSRRWNFNFHTETPLCGRFQWEEIPADCAAAIYQESAQLKDDVCEEDDRLSKEEESAAGIDQENCSSVSNTHKRPAEVTPVRRKRTLSKPAAKNINNARITDFFPKRRKTTETKSTQNPFHTSSNEAALCKTIR